jgi:hypothetical protein
MTEVTYHCINFNDRVRNVPKFIIEIFGTFLTLSLKLMQWYVTSIIRRCLYEKFGNKCVKILTFWRTELSYAQNKNRGKKMCRDHRTQFWKGAIQGPFHKSLVAIGPVVSEEKIKMWNVDGRRTKSDDNSSHGLKARWAKKRGGPCHERLWSFYDYSIRF